MALLQNSLELSQNDISLDLGNVGIMENWETPSLSQLPKRLKFNLFHFIKTPEPQESTGVLKTAYGDCWVWDISFTFCEVKVYFIAEINFAFRKNTNNG